MLDKHKRVGLNIFTRGGKSYIAMDLIKYLRNEKGCKNFLVLGPKAVVNNLRNNTFKNLDVLLSSLLEIGNCDK